MPAKAEQKRTSPSCSGKHMSDGIVWWCRIAPNSTAWLAWWAVQEAAKHCTAARMTTHLGNATQGFAALEQALQAANGRLPQHSGWPPLPPSSSPLQADAMTWLASCTEDQHLRSPLLIWNGLI